MSESKQLHKLQRAAPTSRHILWLRAHRGRNHAAPLRVPIMKDYVILISSCTDQQSNIHTHNSLTLYASSLSVCLN